MAATVASVYYDWGKNRIVVEGIFTINDAIGRSRSEMCRESLKAMGSAIGAYFYPDLKGTTAMFFDGYFGHGGYEHSDAPKYIGAKLLDILAFRAWVLGQNESYDPMKPMCATEWTDAVR